MTNRRYELHDILCSILGSTERVYFQPPESFKLKYPAIVYKLANIDETYADDRVYFAKRLYDITLMTKDPDNTYIDQILQIPGCSFDRSYIVDTLNHYVFNIYY